MNSTAVRITCELLGTFDEAFPEAQESALRETILGAVEHLRETKRIGHSSVSDSEGNLSGSEDEVATPQPRRRHARVAKPE